MKVTRRVRQIPRAGLGFCCRYEVLCKVRPTWAVMKAISLISIHFYHQLGVSKRCIPTHAVDGIRLITWLHIVHRIVAWRIFHSITSTSSKVRANLISSRTPHHHPADMDQKRSNFEGWYLIQWSMLSGWNFRGYVLIIPRRLLCFLLQRQRDMWP